MIKKYALVLIVFLITVVSSFGQIYTEDFAGQNGKGAVGPIPTTDLAGVTWSIDISSAALTASTDWFQVQNEVFEARDIDGDGVWYSPSINISAYTNVYFNLDAVESGTMEAGDLFNTEYRINGGAWTSPATNGSLNDDFTSATVSQTGLSGNTLEIRVTMNNGAGAEYHRLDNILVDGTPVSGNTITVTQATGGTISPGTTNVADNADQSFTATPDACHTFTNWIVNGSNAGSTNPYTFTNVTADHTITAVYTADTYGITSSAGVNGSISPNGVTNVTCGTDQTYTITADSGYAVQDVLVDGVSVGAVTSYDFTNVTATHTISVTFVVYTGPCASESFDNSNANGTYANNSYVGDNGVTWTYTASRDESTFGINGNGLMLRNLTSSLTSSSVAGGIADFTCNLRKAFTGSGNRQVELFVNGVSQGTSISWDNTAVQTFTVSGINISGNVIVEIRNITGNQVIVDDIEWSCYIACTPAADPTGTIAGATPTCNTTDLSFSGTAPTDVVYYWQNTTLGTLQTEDASADLTVTTTGDYYVRAFNTVTSCWSDGEIGPFAVTIINTPVITSQPLGLTVLVGNNAVFNVTATDATNYQWQVSTNGGTTFTNIGTDANSLTVTNAQLTDSGNIYQVIVSNTCGNTTSNQATLTVSDGTYTGTTFNPGELIFVGYDGQVNGSGSNDEFLIATLVDITTGTVFSLVNSRYEAGAAANDRTEKWGGGSNDPSEAPFETKFTYTGASNIPAGSVLRFDVTTSSTFLVYAQTIIGTTATTSTSDFNASVTTIGDYANISTSGADQLYLMQGDFVSDGSIDAGEANYLFNGTLLHGLTNRASWVPLTSVCNGGTTRESRLPAELRCFNVENAGSSAISAFYENDKEHGLATIREIINNVFDVAGNWTLGTGRYTFDPSSTTNTTAGKTFTISPSNPVGQWVGDADTNWFNCANWEGLTVPKPTTDVVIDNTAMNIASIDYTAAYADEVNEIAYANNLTITGSTLELAGNINNVLEVHGDLLLDTPSANLDMNDGNNATADGLIRLYGNWTNNVGTTAFNEGNGTVMFTGNSAQVIINGATPIPPINTEEFYNVILDNDFNTNASNDLYMQGGLTVNTGNILTVTDGRYTYVNLGVTNNGTFNIENNGSLIQGDNAGINTGNISMQRTASMRKLDYVYWSSPIDGFSTNNISAGTPTNRIYSWDATVANTNGSQGNWVDASSTTMQDGVGYIVRGPDAFSATAANYTATFNNGVPLNGIKTVSVSRGSNPATFDTNDDDWNLLGNPYPSAIDAIDFLTLNTNLEGYINIWTHGTLPSTAITDPYYYDFVSNYDENDYLTYNSSGASTGPGTFNGSIAAAQSFMVNMVDGPATTGTVTFNNGLRNLTLSNSVFYRTVNPEKHRIWLDLASEGEASKRILVGYIENATIQADRLYDAISDTDSNKNFYSLIDNTPFKIQGRALPFNDADRIPLGIKTNTSGNYTIAIAAIDGLFETEGQIIYLKDNVLNYTHNLTEAPYPFSSETGEFNDRFEIVFKPEFLSVDENEYNNTLSIVEQPDGSVKFSVSNALEIQNVKIYDVLGRLLYDLKGNSSTEIYNLDTLSQAAYVAKITLSNNVVLTKKAIKRK